MPDMHVQIWISPGSTGDLSTALSEMHCRDSDFLWSSITWWHKAPNNARALLARCLSRHGLQGKLSVEPHPDEAPWDCMPTARWTGFSPKDV
jgi:hypothetical protein